MVLKTIDRIFTALVLVLLPLFMLVAVTTSHAATTWNVGDVFVGISSGQYQVYDNAGVFKETVTDAQGNGFTTGCAFNNALDKLYTTNFSNAKVNTFDNASPHTALQANDPTVDSPGVLSTESIVFAANGDYYVGHADGTSDVVKYNSGGVFQTAYDVPDDNRGSDWVDLAADQNTLFYTSEGRAVQRYDLSANAPLANFAVLPGAGNAFALRILTPGDGSGGVLVADGGDIKRLDGTGTVVQTYDVAGEDFWFALNLDPNGTSFWSGDFGTSNFYRFDIATGAVEVGPINTGTTPGLTLFGLCVKGEITAAKPEITLEPTTATNEAGTDHTVTATVTSSGNPVSGVLVSFSVVAGPNAGQVSDPGECSVDLNCNTDAAGQTSWTYTSNGIAGTDTIQACFTDDEGVEHCARATKEWTEPPSLPGRMTGGGTVPAGANTLEGKHGFELHCDPADLPNRLEVNWGKGNKFHLESLTSALCSNDPSLDEQQPVAGFDTYKGKGTGRLNGVSGATAEWEFTDDGEPGTSDYATISIIDGVNTYTFSGNLKNGNQQAHPEE
ncbi:hypothetical protein HY469_01240 [Candidatus Roizmanbacteria bacterium]|nr:hypothetical protein [Candidatus Roizmanbacteria bacterium]